MKIGPVKVDWFMAGLFVATALAAIHPDPGAPGGWLKPEITNKAGVALVFFLHGIAMSFASLRAGTLRWPVHLFIQTCTFLIFPLLGIALVWLCGRWMSPELRTGFLLLSALPSTISSSVAMTAAARGNVPIAVFNATLSSLIGVVLTPLWVSWMLEARGQDVPVLNVILDLFRWLVLPLVVGQLLRPWFGLFATRHKHRINVVDRLTILFLVYTSFCDSVKRGVWSANAADAVVFTAVGTTALFIALYLITTALSNLCRFPRDERIAAIFCGSKKSLASGVPIAQLIFGSNPALGIYLLPIMIYHPLQLIICGILAGKWAREDAVA